MLGELLGGSLPEQLRDVVLEHSEGNPFFIEELLATMIDRNLIRVDDGVWQMAELPAGFAVPDTVQAVVAARIDLLGSAEKEALQAASVIGRVFWAGPVYELVQGSGPDLRVLEERDFIRRRPGSSLPGDREYAIGGAPASGSRPWQEGRAATGIGGSSRAYGLGLDDERISTRKGSGAAVPQIENAPR